MLDSTNTTTSGPSDEPAMDRHVALKNVGGQANLLRELLDVFLVEQAELLRRIKSSVASSDARELHLAAHTLKGSLRVFAATPSGRIAERLETIGRNATLQGSDAIIGELERELDRLKIEMSAIVQSASNGS